jgi:hypothetical protein
MSKGTCNYGQCTRTEHARGLCSRHHSQARTAGELELFSSTRQCRWPECSEPVALNASGASMGFCRPHYSENISRSRLKMSHAEFSAFIVSGAKKLSEDGYVLVRVGGQLVAEHRHVMQQMLGRKMLTCESVHHVNGQRDDNRPENLELWSTKQPPGQRVEDKVHWAEQILALYAPDKLA